MNLSALLQQLFANLMAYIRSLFVSPPAFKPVVYLYSEQETDVSVKLDLAGELTVSYPAYGEGWEVRAEPGGRLTNKADGREYSYLFWEGVPRDARWDLSQGWCVPGRETAAFLQGKLAELGLTPPEYNEFIVYWLPQMQDNAYNLITFQWEDYDRLAPLRIEPAPAAMLRVFMVFKPLTKPVEVAPPADRPAFVRRGFSVVEWGGTKAA